MRGIDGGLLVQEGDLAPDDASAWKVVTVRAPDDAERRALSLREPRPARRRLERHRRRGRERDVRHRRRAHEPRGRLPGRRRQGRRARAKGAVAASDAFFPFPDGLEVLAAAGVTAVVQPGGSVKDADVIAAADAAGIAMVFTGKRHFRH